MGQTKLSITAIIYIKRSCANHILQVSVDRIIDIFGRKNRESFMRSVRFTYFVIYWVKKIRSIALIVF